METEQELPKPQDRAPRWMNDNDLNTELVIVDVMKGRNNRGQDTVMLHLQHGLEDLQRECVLTGPEYAYLYNNLGNSVKTWVGAKLVYKKGNDGFRKLIEATR